MSFTQIGFQIQSSKSLFDWLFRNLIGGLLIYAKFLEEHGVIFGPYFPVFSPNRLSENP